MDIKIHAKPVTTLTHFSNYIYFLSHSSLWLLQTIIFVRESDLIDQRRILSIIHAHCFKLSKNVPFQNMVENPSNALMVCAISEKPKICTTRYFSLTDFKNNLVYQSAAIRWLHSSGIEAVNAAAGGTFGRLRLTFSTLYLLKERKKSLGEI